MKKLKPICVLIHENKIIARNLLRLIFSRTPLPLGGYACPTGTDRDFKNIISHSALPIRYILQMPGAFLLCFSDNLQRKTRANLAGFGGCFCLNEDLHFMSIF